MRIKKKYSFPFIELQYSIFNTTILNVFMMYTLCFLLTVPSAIVLLGLFLTFDHEKLLTLLALGMFAWCIICHPVCNDA